MSHLDHTWKLLYMVWTYLQLLLGKTETAKLQTPLCGWNSTKLLTARIQNGLMRAIASFWNPQTPSLNTKSPYVFEYGHSMKSATILLGREAHPKWKAHLPCYLKRRDIFLLPYICASVFHFILSTGWTLQLFIYFSNFSGLCLPLQSLLPSNLPCSWNQTAGEHMETTANCTNSQHRQGQRKTNLASSCGSRGIFDYHSVNSVRSVFKVLHCYSDSKASQGQLWAKGTRLADVD